MKSMEEIVNIQEDKLAYDKIIERLQEAKENRNSYSKYD